MLRFFQGTALVACRCDDGGAGVGWQSTALHLYGQTVTNVNTKVPFERHSETNVEGLFRVLHRTGPDPGRSHLA